MDNYIVEANFLKSNLRLEIIKKCIYSITNTHNLITNTESLPDTNDFSILYDSIIWDKDRLDIVPTKDELFIKYRNVIINYPMIRLKCIRRGKLKDTDYLVSADYTHLSDEEKQQWLKYRQELRDLPSISNPQLNNNCLLINVTWPIPPKNIYIEDMY
jgi:hypothetical protein